MNREFEYPVRDVERLIEMSRGGPVTARSWASYKYIFGWQDLPGEYWEGKRLLDVGSGEKTDLPEWTFGEARWSAVDPEFGGQVGMNTAHEKRRGVVQALPWADDEFDGVVSSHAVPQHMYPVDMPRGVLEVLRVVRPEGWVRLAPCTWGRAGADISPELEAALRGAGFGVRGVGEGSDGEVVEIRNVGEAATKRRRWEAVRDRLYPPEVEGTS